jgi:putative FmdB family regulatory protein
MPIYDYLCSSCGQTTEVIHGIDAPAPRFCPACGAEATLRKAFAAPAVLFKGSGWAKKDRSSWARSKASPGPTSGDSSDGAGKASSSDSTSKGGESPPASKTSTGSDD